MWLIFSLFFVGISCDVVKYEFDGKGNWNDRLNWWIISDHPTRPCRAEEGFIRCKDKVGVDICTPRSTTERCRNNQMLECSNDEMKMLVDNKYRCIARWNIRNHPIYANIYLPCQSTEFQCSLSKLCIPRAWIRDRQNDCNQLSKKIMDDSDESGMLSNCREEIEVRCSSNFRCIPRSWIGNGVVDCSNAEDENITLNCKTETEFMCPLNKRCILRRHVNDNFNDCPSGDDELVNNFTCTDELEFSCDKTGGVGRCIPKEWVGNGVEDCSNGEDERHTNCHDIGFACSDQTKCLHNKYLCDGIPHCRNGEDEVEVCDSPTMYRYKPQRLIPWSFLLFHAIETINRYYRDFKPKQDLSLGLKCYVRGTVDKFNPAATKLRTVPQLYIVNNMSVCSNYEDLCFDAQKTFQCTRCLDGTIISNLQVCDGVVDCKDLSDECPCQEAKVEELCKVMFPAHNKPEDHKLDLMDLVCNGKTDISNDVDEKYCNSQALYFIRKETESSEDYSCAWGNLDKLPASRIPLYCDGNIDCPFMEDECSKGCILRTAESTNTVNKNCFPFLRGPDKDNKHYYNVSISNNGSKQLYKSPSTSDKYNETNHDVICEYGFHFSFHVSDNYYSYGNYYGYYDDFRRRRKKRSTNYREVQVSRVRSIPSDSNLCKMGTESQYNLEYLCDIKGVNCPWFHFCDGERRKRSITIMCNYKRDCRDNSDEDNCSSLTHFYCKSGQPLFIPRYKVGDGRSDCADRSDEIRETLFSSRTEMLKNIFLRHFVWVCSCVIIVCNGIVLRKHFRRLKKVLSKTSLAYCNTYLLINLAISDAIFGFTLLTIGINSYGFSGHYNEFDLEWRTSLTCNMIGIFTIIASQTSVNLLVLITGLRFYITYRPYMSKRIVFNLLVVFSLLSFLVSIILAVYPVFGNRNFVTSFHIKSNPFLNADVVNPSIVENYVRKTEMISLLTNFSHNFTKSGRDTFISQKLQSWVFNSQIGRSDFPKRQIYIRGSFMFYSSSSVCLPDFYSPSSPASEYSLLIVLYNLSSLFLVSIGYLILFNRAKKSSASVQTLDEERVNKKNKKMMKRIFFIVVTDILCWLPVIVMTILNYGGYKFPGIVHPLSAIVFLPINSLINPIIYSRLYKIVKTTLVRLCGPIRRRCCPTRTTPQ